MHGNSPIVAYSTGVCYMAELIAEAGSVDPRPQAAVHDTESRVGTEGRRMPGSAACAEASWFPGP